MKKRILLSLLAALGITAAYSAPNDITIIGSKVTTISLYDRHNHKTGTQQVSVERLKLSEAAKKALAERVHAQITDKKKKALPDRYDLGMRDLAPLNQGVHGTCATFATTGLLNAASPAKNPNPNYFASQLCSLELGNYLHAQNRNYPSGWTGSTASVILRQVQAHGIVMMMYQQNPGCAGVTEYPVNDVNNVGRLMSPTEYAQLSQQPFPNLSWKTLYNFGVSLNKPEKLSDIVDNIKQTLFQGTNDNTGHRVLLGFLLDANVGNAGAIGHHTKTGDSWIITRQIQRDIDNRVFLYGHEIIITGYDDNAVITAADGTTNVGAFILRNSWGYAGDQGNYYMSYDYVRRLADDIIEVIPG